MGDESVLDLERIPAVLRGAADAAEKLAQLRRSPTPQTEPGTRYFKRSTAPAGAGGRVWDRAVAELAPKGLVFRPGKECLIRCDDYYRWIEAHPIKRSEKPVSEADDEPIPFDRARTRSRGRRLA